MNRGVPVAAILCLAALAGAAVAGHPALRGGHPLAREAVGIAQAVSEQGRHVDLLAWADRGSVPALLALFAALAYIGGWLLLRACPGRPLPPERSSWPLGAAAAGHAAAATAALWGAQDVAVHTAGTLTTAALFGILLGRSRPRSIVPGPSWIRVPGALGYGALLVAAVRPFDTLLLWLTGVPVWPPLWHSLVTLTVVFSPPHLVLAASALAALAGLAWLETRTAGLGFPGSWLTMGAAWTLVLGPSEPLHGLTVAFVTTRMAAAGHSFVPRLAFVALVVLLQVLAALLV